MQPERHTHIFGSSIKRCQPNPKNQTQILGNALRGERCVLVEAGGLFDGSMGWEELLKENFRRRVCVYVCVCVDF